MKKKDNSRAECMLSVYYIVFAMGNESYYESIIAGKRFGEHCGIQIAIDYEMKFKNYFTSSFWLKLV